MKIESRIFGLGVFFFVPVALIYGFLTNWSEWVGILGVLLVGGLAGMIGAYLAFTGKRVGMRPEDRSDAEIHEGAGEQGHFSPWSWWPLVLGLASAAGFLGMAIGFWIVYIAARPRARRPGRLGVRIQPRRPRALTSVRTRTKSTTTAGPTFWWGPPSLCVSLVRWGRRRWPMAPAWRAAQRGLAALGGLAAAVPGDSRVR